ncbi:MAG: hypothetical protein J1F64_11320 [Oscillospiraceae bacterium]|nr:hypothetical protein [Oscillospiraceae bacterium]
MTHEQMQAEIGYKISMNMAKSMLEQGLLTKSEYAEFDTIMLKKYAPILGTLR